MELHILLAGVEFGPYTDDKARQLLDEGFLNATDPAKRLDETNWLPLNEVLAATPVAAGAGAFTSLPSPPEFRLLAAALEDEEPAAEFHAPLPAGSEVAEATLPEDENESLPEPEIEEPAPAPKPVMALEPTPAPVRERPTTTNFGGLTAPSVVAASRVTRAIGPRPSLEPLSSPPPTAPLPAMPSAARTTRRLARVAREQEEESPGGRPKSAPVASAEIKSSFAAALAKTRSVASDPAPLPAPTRSGGKPLPQPEAKPAPEDKPVVAPKPAAESKPVAESNPVAESKPEAAARPAESPRPSAPPAPPSPSSTPSRTSPVRTTSLNATQTAPLTVTARAKRPTVTGSLLAKEALLKAREKGTGLLASRMTAPIALAADFRPEALAAPRKRVPVKLAGPEAPAAPPAAPQRRAIRLTGPISLTGRTTAPEKPVELEPTPAPEPAVEAKPTPVEPAGREPAPTPRPSPPVQLRESRDAELTKAKSSTSRKAIRLTGPISLPGRSTQPTRPGPLAPAASETGPLTTSFPRTLGRSRLQTPPAAEPAAPVLAPALAPAEEPKIPPAPAAAGMVEPRLPERPRMSLRSLIHPAETAATSALAAEALSPVEQKTEPEMAPGGSHVSSGSLKITGALRAPAPPRSPIRLSSPSGESGLQASTADAPDAMEVKLSAPVPEEELMNRPASGKIPVSEFPTEGVRVRTRRVTAKVPLPEVPSESISYESPARQSPPPLPLPPKVELPGVPFEYPAAEADPGLTAPPAEEATEPASLPAPPPVENVEAPPTEPEVPVAEPPPPSPAAKPEKVRLRKPVKLELTSRKIQESDKLSLEAFSKLASHEKPGGPTVGESATTEVPEFGESPASPTIDGFSSRKLEEAPPLTWASARRAAPFPLEWIFYGIIGLGFVAAVTTTYVVLHHGKRAPANGTPSASAETTAAATSSASATPPPSAAPPPDASAPPAATTPETTTAAPATNATAAPVPPPSSPADEAARQASAFVSDGTLKYQHGDFDGAISAYNQALALDPKSTQALFNRGIAKAAHDDLDGAVADYSQALEVDPNMGQAYYYRGLARHSKAELDGAISDYNNAVRIDPKNALAFFNRGLIRMQKDDIDGAIVDSTSALELDPKLIQSYYDRGLGRLAKGASDGALDDMKTFTQLAPQDAYTDYARLYIWLIQTEQGQLAEANKELSAAMNTSWNGKSDDMVTRIGEFLLGQISDSDLIKASSSSVPAKDQGQRCEAWYFIGMRKLEAGDKDGAAEALRKCVDTQKTDYCEFILAQEELKRLLPGTTPQPETLPAPRAQTAGLPDPGTMAPPDSAPPPIPH